MTLISVTGCRTVVTQPAAAGDDRNAGHHHQRDDSANADREQGKAMDDAMTQLAELDDFEVIAERARVAEMLAALTDRYRQLNHEMNRRETLRWMLH